MEKSCVITYGLVGRFATAWGEARQIARQADVFPGRIYAESPVCPFHCRLADEFDCRAGAGAGWRDRGDCRHRAKARGIVAGHAHFDSGVQRPRPGE